jgi:glycosyltransferase involved in cell wall biosynthesis
MKKTICLNMIVKNESPVIQKCLASTKRFIDYWVIADTGSTDGTQELIRNVLQDIPGEFYERPWVDFSHNRNEVLTLSKTKADYILFIDADEMLLFPDEFTMPDLNKDHYFIQIMQPDGSQYFRVFLIKNELNWQWKGVLHEEIISPEAKTVEILQGITNYSASHEGHRTQNPDKFLQDTIILEKALEKEPNNTRYLFFLAISYGNLKNFTLALKYHQKRVDINDGNEEEIFFSLLCIANAQENLEYAPATFLESYSQAYLYRPTRVEPLYGLVCYYAREEKTLLAYLIAKFALSIPSTKDKGFVLQFIYDTGLLYQFADCSYKLGYYQETRETYKKLLQRNLPSEKRAQIERNLASLSSQTI